ncbi:MAG: sigma-54-dependent Fis family transcriptional regulator [Candidatus Cloacimonetes bacterium]|nr:sigma-54-dependent Fis family transcriptional regulator [Candidatus Cloacimonadota bacterium]
MKKILVIDDEESISQSLKRLLSKRGWHAEAFQNPVAALNLLQRERFDIVLTDFRMPNVDGLEMIERIREIQPEARIILMTAFSSIPNAVEAMKRGASEYIPKPFEFEELEARLGVIGPSTSQSVSSPSKKTVVDMLGTSLPMQRLRERIRKAAKSNATVLIEGESGTGKELVARLLHQESSLSSKPFLAVNMAAIPDSLIESEFFGYKKGAFTGADSDQDGKFVAADGGTLFLDEIGEMPIQFQPKILRVLQEGVVTPVGSNKTHKVQVRIVAATNRDLSQMVHEGTFREDLFFRLNILDIKVPPLRERREDIPELVTHFIEKHATEPMQVPQDFLDILSAYHWPGNVRELENIIHRCVVLGDTNVMDKLDLPRHISGLEPTKDTPMAEIAYRALKEGMSLYDLEKDIILKAIEESEGNKTTAARILKITRRKLYSRLEKHGIDL